MNNIFRMITNVNAAYERALSENDDQSRIMEAQLIAMERSHEVQQCVDEMRRLSNRREKVDDEGNIIPNDDNCDGSWASSRIKMSENASWICDKCMAINFGCQTSCPECGDRKDEKDERLK